MARVLSRVPRAAATAVADLERFRLGAAVTVAAACDSGGGGGSGGGDDDEDGRGDAAACSPPANKRARRAHVSLQLEAEAGSDGGVAGWCGDGTGGGHGSSGTAASGPKDWREVYENVVRMRAARDAPVDSMGAEASADADAAPAVRRCVSWGGQSCASCG